MLLMDQAEETASTEFIREISLAAKRVANLTRQLLVFSRKQATQAKNIDLNEVIKNLGKMLRRVLATYCHRVP